MRKTILILLSVLFVFAISACSVTRADKRAERNKGSVAESRVRDRRKLQSGENAITEDSGKSAEVVKKEETESKEKITLKLAEVHEAGYPTTLADERFAELVSEATDGRIIIEVYSDGKLGEESAVIEGMQNGTIDFARVSVSPMAKYSPELNALSLPYLYNDSDHMWKVLNSDLGQSMLESVSNADLVGLAWYDGGSRNFFANREIKSIDDFKGLRLRMQNNPLMFGLAESLGCEPVDMSMGDINASIEQNILDGAENNIPTYESYKHVNFAPYFILDSHSRIPEILAGSEKVFSGLSAEDQKIIKECAKQTQEYEIEEWEKREKESRKIVEEQGAKFIEPSDELMEDIREACEPLYDEFAADYKDVVKEIKDMA